MKKLMLSVVAALAVLATANTALAADIKVGVLNLQTVLRETPQTAKIKNDLKKQFGSREKELAAQQKELSDDIQELRRNKSVMKASSKEALEKKIMSKQQDLQRAQRSFQQDLIAAQNKAMQSLLKQVKSVVDRVAKQKDLDLVLTTESVAYVNPSMDITKAIAAQLK